MWSLAFCVAVVAALFKDCTAAYPDWKPPCATQTVSLPAATAQELDIDITSAVITLPKTSGTCKGEAPVVVFHAGFLLGAENYQEYADLMASFGFAVLQYNLPTRLLNPIDFEVEAQALPKITAWAKTQLQVAGTSGYMAPDWGQLIAAGHSRGGWISFLQLDAKLVKTAALLDAVAPRGAKYPNPELPYLFVDGIQSFSICAPSWWGMERHALPRGRVVRPNTRIAMPRAGHMQFANTGAAAELWNIICGRGAIINRSVREQAASLLTGYLLEYGYSSLAVAQHDLDSFRAWRADLIERGIFKLLHEDGTGQPTAQSTRSQPEESAANAWARELHVPLV